MAKIRKLPKNIAELIAAGEVCERPSSVVKELIENSIDAGASKITVEIRNGGIKYIRITDDGSGIEREDVKTAFLSHATSKIETDRDLDAISTLGFRGEALASVAAVSKTEMLTKTKNASFGTRYLIEGGGEVLLDDAGCPDGTTLVVRDLFYNTPARMKFLKRDFTEGNYVSDVVLKAALSHPDISFRLIKDDKETLFTPGNGDLKATIFAAYGKDFAEGLIECDYELNGVFVKGYISNPLNARKNRNMQHFFVNMRYVKIPFAAAALDQAYKNSIMQGKFPSAVLFIDVPPNTLDVNVHPAKTEVRFADERRVFEAVFYAAKNALAKDNTRPQLKFAQKKDEIKSYNDFLKSQKQTNEGIRLDDEAPSGINSFLHGKILPGPDRVEDKKADMYADGGQLRLHDDTSSYQSKPAVNLDIEVTPSREDRQEDGQENIASPSKEADIDLLQDENSQDLKTANNEHKHFKVLGEAFKTYLIVEFEDRLILIDKHAAHERMIYDSLRKKDREVFSQALLSPMTLTLSLREYSAIIENLGLLKEAGYNVEDFGEGSLIVREVPIDLAYDDIVSVIEELAGYLCGHVKSLMNEKLEWLYHNTACRAAIKAGKDLHPAEMQDFAQKVFSDPSLKFCPHGRPVWIEMSQKELEKQFGRIN